eukprot:Tamp_06083.p2 GENE.Tamp_06083~~Tamp_06083.p2  ORF type:complete len:271 (-),score=60.36 Tamp_06083:439-1251(-)
MTSAQYLSLNDSDGELVAAVADMAIFSYLTPDSLTEEDIAAAAILVVDGNLPVLSLRHICQLANKIKVPVFLEPTSVPKAVAAAEQGVMNYVTFTSPNEKELRAMAAAVLRRKGVAEADGKHTQEAQPPHQAAAPASSAETGSAAALGADIDMDDTIQKDISVLLDVGVEVVLVTGGSKGIFFGTIDVETGAPAIVHFPANVVPPAAIANTTGAGDSFAGAFVCAASRQWPLDQAVALGQAAAAMALYSHAPVSNELTMESLAKPGDDVT